MCNLCFKSVHFNFVHHSVCGTQIKSLETSDLYLRSPKVESEVSCRIFLTNKSVALVDNFLWTNQSKNIITSYYQWFRGLKSNGTKWEQNNGNKLCCGKWPGEAAGRHLRLTRALFVLREEQWNRCHFPTYIWMGSAAERKSSDVWERLLCSTS